VIFSIMHIVPRSILICFAASLALLFHACKRPEQRTFTKEPLEDGTEVAHEKMPVDVVKPVVPEIPEVVETPSFPFERKLTDSEGRMIHAEILGKIEGKIALRRLSDEKRFVIPLEKLSKEDRDFFQNVPEGKQMLASTKANEPPVKYERKRQAEWLNDFDKAKKDSVKNKLKVFMLFTGTSWCPPCRKLEKMVLQTDEFKALANEHLNLVKYDYPKRTVKGSERDKKAKQFNIKSYPTVLITDAEGNILRTRVGIGSENLEDYIQDLKAFLTKGGNYLIPSD